MIPISASKFSSLSLIFSSSKIENEMCVYLKRKHCFLFSAGSQAIKQILQVLSLQTGRTEVIMPAYTASSIYIAIREAGCKIKFCDMSLQSFNMDLEHLKSIVNENTLAIIAVHLFANPEDMETVETIAKQHSIYVIDDMCQAFGSKLSELNVGSFGVASVLSFGKGKNLPALNGGALFLDDDIIAASVEEKYKDLYETGIIGNFKIFLKIFALSICSRPLVYGFVRNILASFREVPAPEKIVLEKMPKVQKMLAWNMFKKKFNNLNPRFVNGSLLQNFLAEHKDFEVPEISPKRHVVWNRFPVIVKDLSRKDQIKKELLALGIETNELYYKPVFDQFEAVQVDRKQFKNAIYMAKHLLTLPVHCFVRSRHIQIIKKCFQ